MVAFFQNMSYYALVSFFLKIVKLVINIGAIIIYRIGFGGKFLGIGGTFNLYEDRNADAEILGSGILAGYLIYNLSTMITFCAKKERSANDVLMNATGVFLWTAAGGTDLHYWSSYQPPKFQETLYQKEMGLTLGSLIIINAFLYLVDAYYSFQAFLNVEVEEESSLGKKDSGSQPAKNPAESLSVAINVLRLRSKGFLQGVERSEHVKSYGSQQLNPEVLTIILLILYRTGYGGQFLGIGGTWNLHEDKNPDAEILGSGVLVGFFIYNLSTVITYCLARERTANDVLMNVIGVFLWVAVAGTALHYWAGYQNEHKSQSVDSARDIGLALGALSVLNAAAHLIDSFFAFRLYQDYEK